MGNEQGRITSSSGSGSGSQGKSRSSRLTSLSDSLRKLTQNPVKRDAQTVGEEVAKLDALWEPRLPASVPMDILPQESSKGGGGVIGPVAKAAFATHGIQVIEDTE